jgi:phosphate transport system permease protein
MPSPSENPFKMNPMERAHRIQRRMFWSLRIATYMILLFAGIIFADIMIKGGGHVLQWGFPFVNVEFLTERPQTLHVFEHQNETYELSDNEFRAFLETREVDAIDIDNRTYAYSGGGIFPAIMGTVLLVSGAIGIALILGIFSAVYLSEYARDTAFIRLVRLSVINLAGVPSIVFGLFGFGMFVLFFGWGVSLLAGWFTLAFMVLPIIITASEEALRAVPMGYREGALALGATRWQTIRTNVLPYALPGILTSSILSIARVAGETAPILFTAAFAIRDQMPWEVEEFQDFFFQGVMALPYHIYVVSSKIPQNPYTENMQYGTAFVFLFLVALIALTSIILRQRIRQKSHL